MAAPAQKQSTIAPIMQGISGAAGAFSGIDFSPSGGTKPPVPNPQPQPQSRAQAAGWANGMGNQLY